MPRTRDSALIEYQKQIGKVLNCVADTWVYSYSISADVYLLIASPGGAQAANLGIAGNQSRLRLARNGQPSMLLWISQRFRLVAEEDFRISTIKYIYIVERNENERLIDWHYHRRQNAGPEAHLHIRADGGEAKHPLVDRHIPTGRVPLEDVVRFLVQEVNILPRRNDWKDVLDETEAVFRANKTW